MNLSAKFAEASADDLNDALLGFFSNPDIQPISVSVLESGGTWYAFLIYRLFV